MSSYDGGGFDEWVRDSLLNVTEEQATEVLRIMEPLREEAEVWLEDYDAETMSWRDFRNSLWGYVPSDLDAAVDAVLKPSAPQPRKGDG